MGAIGVAIRKYLNKHGSEKAKHVTFFNPTNLAYPPLKFADVKLSNNVGSFVGEHKLSDDLNTSIVNFLKGNYDMKCALSAFYTFGVLFSNLEHQPCNQILKDLSKVYDFVVSNLHGTTDTLYFNKKKIKDVLCFMPNLVGIHISICALTYCGKFRMSMTRWV